MRVAASVAQGRLCRATDAVAKAGAPFGRKLKGMWIIDPLTGQADVTNVYGAGPGNIHRRITSRTRVYKRYGNGEPLGISTAGPAKIARAGRGSHVANGSLSVDGDTRGVRCPPEFAARCRWNPLKCKSALGRIALAIFARAIQPLD
jgi:hypothetical protein